MLYLLMILLILVSFIVPSGVSQITSGSSFKVRTSNNQLDNSLTWQRFCREHGVHALDGSVVNAQAFADWLAVQYTPLSVNSRFVCVCVFVCLFVCLCVCLFVCLFVCCFCCFVLLSCVVVVDVAVDDGDAGDAGDVCCVLVVVCLLVVD